MASVENIGGLPPAATVGSGSAAPSTPEPAPLPASATPSTKVDLTSVAVGSTSSSTGAPPAQVQRAVQQLNQYMQVVNRELNFTQDHSGTHFIQVIDPRTHQVLRQIPDKAAVAMAEAIDAELMAHLASNKKA